MVQEDEQGEVIRCRWPGCTRTRTSGLSCFVRVGEGDWWCVDDHLLPDLPEPEMGRMDSCVHCGKGSIHWLDLTPIHPRCVLAWTMGIVEVKASGAYARRRATR